MSGKGSKVDLRKSLKGDRNYNPFNNDFDFVEILQDIRDNSANVDKLDLSTALCSFYFNHYYQDFYTYFKDTIHSFNLGVDKLNEFLFATANRDYYLITRRSLELLKHKNVHLQGISNLSVDSQVKEFGKLDLFAGIEGTVDFLNTAINFTRYFKDLKPAGQQNSSDTKVIDATSKIYRLSNIYDIIKKSYDSAIWEDGYITSSEEGKVLHIKYKNERYPVIIRIGSHRLDSNSLHFYMSSRKRFESSETSFKSIIGKHLRKYNTNRHIQSVYLDKGFVKFNLEDGQDNDSILCHLRLESPIAAYYLFIEDRELPQLGDLSLKELIALFVELQQLLYEVAQIEVPNDEIRIPEDFQKFTYRLKIEDLRSYLKLKTVFSESQVNTFLQLLEYAGGRYDLWNKPLVRQNDYYLFLFLPIVDANILYLVDFWLKQGGYSLDDRGLLFEDHVKRVVQFELERKGFIFNIPQTKKFMSKDGNSEEVDFMVNLKHTLLIAEVKCIKFPMEPRHFHNALKRLEEGAIQVSRKADFIYRNREFLKDEIGSIEGKDILKIVITNFPIFTGLKLKNVPVVDFFLLEAYVNTGEISDEQITFQNWNRATEKKTNLVKFYSDEDEFLKNIRACMESPPVVEKFGPLFRLVDQRITPKGVAPVIYAQIAKSSQE